MITFLLFIVRVFRKLYELMGVDFNQLMAIVRTKLLMDDRRQTSAMGQQNSTRSNQFLLALFFYFVMGMMASFLIGTLPSFILGMALFHSFLIVLVSMTLIADFSSVLLDTSDNTIILPRPVAGKTLVAARITHILLYLGQITTCLFISPFVVTCFKYGFGTGLALVITTGLSVIFAVVLTNGLYLLLMQWTSQERLKTVINYFQIVITIVIMGGYQILPRMIGDTMSDITDFDLSWWAILVPPFWMAGALDLLHSHQVDLLKVLCTILTLSVPIGGFYVMNKYLTPLFTEKLTDLGTSTAVIHEKSQHKKERIRLRSLLTQPGIERGTYGLVTSFMARDRKFKLKVYPSMGYLFVMAFIIMFQGKHSLKIMFNQLPSSSTHIFLLYAAFFVVQTAMAEIVFSDEFKAAWIFRASPIQKPGMILSGALKAVLVRMFLPAYGLFSLFIFFVWGTDGLDDIIFGIGSNLFLFMMIANIGAKHFPLSIEPTARKNGETLARLFAILLVLAVVGGLHFLLSKVPYALWIGILPMLGGVYAMMRAYQHTEWKQIEG